ncbi:ribonuclease H-like domain-containing protein [Tanacetum coccineum]
MLVADLTLLKTSFSSPTLKVIFLLKTSILEWAVDKNGRPRIKGTSSSSVSAAGIKVCNYVEKGSKENDVKARKKIVGSLANPSTTNTQVSPASTQVSTANLSDDTIYAFLASQPNGSQLVYEDLEQIHEDDIEEMDLKWQLALLSMRIRSYMADDEVPTNMALMAFSDSEVHNDKTCSKTCLKSFETLKTQLDDLRIEFNKSEFNFIAIINGVRSVEENLSFTKRMSLDKLIRSQILDKTRKGVGFINYNAVPPPPTGLFSPTNLDLSYSGLEEFQQLEFEGYGPKPSKSVSEDISNEVRESPDAPLVEELVSDDKLEKKTVFPTVAKIEFVRPKQQEKPVRKPVKYAEMYMSQSPRGNQRNWNNQKSQQLGSGPLEKVVSENNYTRVNYNYSSKKAHPSAHKNMVPRAVLMKTGPGHPQKEDQGYVDSGCSRHMTGNMSYLSDFKEFDGGYVTFRGGAKGGKITGKGTLKTGKLDFEDVYFVKELQFNLFSVSHMCDKKNSVLFTDTGCFVLSPDFKLADESQVLLKVPRKNNMYSIDMKNSIPKESLTCLVAKATLDESMLWHKRLGHVNFKTINKLVKENLVRGLPSKRFENDQTCVACLKGKQHKASSSKGETSGILKSFITEIENLVDKKVKIIRCDNGTEFKNRVMSDFCEKKRIKREFSVARTPQQNGVAERRNRTLIEAARTMLANSKLPTTFLAEVVNTACYVQNRVLVVKPHNKTPYELFRGRTPALIFMRPFGCHVIILNTLHYFGKFDGKSDEGFFVGCSLNTVMLFDSAITYTSVHSEARSWSIPSEDPYEEAARQLLEQAPRPSEYVPNLMELDDHVPVYILEPEHPEDLVPAEDEAPIEPYITEVASAPTPPLLPPSLLPTLIRPPHTRAAMA